MNWIANIIDVVKDKLNPYLSGEGTPNNQLGSNGQYYIDSISGKIYKKYNNVWDICFEPSSNGNGSSSGGSGEGLTHLLSNGRRWITRSPTASSITISLLSPIFNLSIDEFTGLYQDWGVFYYVDELNTNDIHSSYRIDTNLPLLNYSTYDKSVSPVFKFKFNSLFNSYLQKAVPASYGKITGLKFNMLPLQASYRSAGKDNKILFNYQGTDYTNLSKTETYVKNNASGGLDREYGGTLSSWGLPSNLNITNLKDLEFRLQTYGNDTPAWIFNPRITLIWG